MSKKTVLSVTVSQLTSPMLSEDFSSSCIATTAVVDVQVYFWGSLFGCTVIERDLFTTVCCKYYTFNLWQYIDQFSRLHRNLRTVFPRKNIPVDLNPSSLAYEYKLCWNSSMNIHVITHCFLFQSVQSESTAFFKQDSNLIKASKK